MTEAPDLSQWPELDPAQWDGGLRRHAGRLQGLIASLEGSVRDERFALGKPWRNPAKLAACEYALTAAKAMWARATAVQKLKDDVDAKLG